MKAVILVGGKATRLMPITSHLPKALVPVLNTPFLEHVIRHLRRHDINEIVLSLGNLAEPIQNYFGDGSRFGVKMHYAVESSPLGTGGGIKNAERYLDGTFVALNGDVFTDLDITEMADFHRRNLAKATIALTKVENISAYGAIEIDHAGEVVLFREKPAAGEVKTNFINAGTYILEPEVLEAIRPGVQTSIEREIFPQIMTESKLFALYSPAYWLDIGTPEKYLQVHRDLLEGRCCAYNLNGQKQEPAGSQTPIPETARITGPVLIGANCHIGTNVRINGPAVIGQGCHLGCGAEISGSVIWHDSWIARGAVVKNSIIADHCRLSAESAVEDSILGRGVTVGGGYRLAAGSKVDAETILGQSHSHHGKSCSSNQHEH